MLATSATVLYLMRGLNARLLALFFALIFTTGCSDSPGGGGIGGTGDIHPAQTAGSGIVIGNIQSVDTFTIEDRVFTVQGAEVLINGKSASVEELRTGMLVVAKVNFEQQNIEEIEYQPLVAGPIRNLRDNRLEFTVVDQTVRISELTYMDEITSEDLFEEVVVEVGGDRNSSGVIEADYIRFYDPADPYFVLGNVDISPDNTEMANISGTEINVQPFLENNPSSAIENGSTIRVEIEPESISMPENTPPVVTNAALVPDVIPEVQDIIVISGIVKESTPPDEFVVRNYVFIYTENTQFLNSLNEEIDAVDIQENNVVTVTGISLGTDRNIMVSKVKIKKR